MIRVEWDVKGGGGRVGIQGARRKFLHGNETVCILFLVMATGISMWN